MGRSDGKIGLYEEALLSGLDEVMSEEQLRRIAAGSCNASTVVWYGSRSPFIRVVFLNALSQERLRYANLLNALGR